MNVYNLAANQDTLMHVVEESISILNVSRIKEYRQRINDLLMLIGSVEDKVINMSFRARNKRSQDNRGIVFKA